MVVSKDVLGLRYLRQRAVYWAPGAPDPSGGGTFATPIIVRCRWHDKNILFWDKTGNQVVSRSSVAVAQEVVLGGALGLMGKGKKLTDYSANPYDNEGVYEIKGYNKIPNKKASKFWREALL